MIHISHNLLKVSGSSGDVKKFMRLFSGRRAKWVTNSNSLNRTGPSLNSLYPVPRHYESEGVLNEEGSMWLKMHWGTESDIQGEVEHEYTIDKQNRIAEVTYRFATAWTAPLGWLFKVANDFPGLVFNLYYFDAYTANAGLVNVNSGKYNRCIMHSGVNDIEQYKKLLKQQFGVVA